MMMCLVFGLRALEFAETHNISSVKLLICCDLIVCLSNF